MNSQISIIMYHYVRDLKNSRFLEIKGLSVDLFKEQLKYILKNYNILSMEEFIAALKSKKELPKKAASLTFDDGYIDHFVHAFPVLKKLSIKASFFPSAKSILHNEVLDVNKIHFILASIPDRLKLIKEIYLLLDKHRTEYLLKDNDYYFKKLAMANRFDNKEVMFIKRLLQKELPERPRKEIIKYLFSKYVTNDETSFFKELYMDVEQLKCMKKEGMYIGSHGFDHIWLDRMDKYAQESEIEMSLKFLKEKIKCNIDDWVMCYPYGAYNDSLLSILRKKGCIIGLTSEPRIADINRDDLLTLPRLDTNDLVAGSAHGC